MPRKGVFISYRRSDDSHAAARLWTGLRERFGNDRVFFDIAMATGVDYVDAIEDALDNCAVLLAIIGPRWVEIADDQGMRRLDDPADIVVREIKTALDKRIQVVPVLLDGTPMPTSDDLPEQLGSLARQNAAVLNHVTFEDGLRRLLDDLEVRLRPPMRRWRPPGKVAVVVTIATLLLLCGLFALYRLGAYWYPISACSLLPGAEVEKLLPGSSINDAKSDTENAVRGTTTCEITTPEEAFSVYVRHHGTTIIEGAQAQAATYMDDQQDILSWSEEPPGSTRTGPSSASGTRRMCLPTSSTTWRSGTATSWSRSWTGAGRTIPRTGKRGSPDSPGSHG